MKQSASGDVPTAKCLLAITRAFGLGGGIATANRLVIYTLNDEGYEIDVFALTESQTMATGYSGFPALRYVAFSGNKIRFAFAVWRALLTRRYTLVFCDHVNLASVLALPSILRLSRYITRLNGIEVFEPRPDGEGRLGLKWAWRRIAISEFTKKKVQGQFPDLEIKVCDLALNPDQSRRVETMPERDQGEIRMKAVTGDSQLLGNHILLHVGRMVSSEQYKGQDVLIRAMPRIISRFSDAQLVLVGEGDDASRLLDLAKTQPQNVRSAIFMPGYAPDELLQQLYAQCYLFAMPSRGEGFGLVYLEAMSWGKPCIGSRVDAAQYVIRDNETGLLVNDPTDAEEVANCALRLLNCPDQAQAMGLAGFNVLKNYYLFSHFKARFWQSLEM